MTGEADGVEVIPHTWITLADGTRLSARLWLPAGAHAEPVPAVLEYLPYRKDDLTARRDAPIAAYHAMNGYAYARVDIRGTGDSDGIITDEYPLQEQDDALEVIAWMAGQPWCSGWVGMVGISWGGFNGLQVAARQPPALRAVISMCSTDDRYRDDVHYDGGCVLATEMLPWASFMLPLNFLPPDPGVVGDSWRATWFDRLENTPPFIDTWLEHQRRDDYWKHGSVAEDFATITCPVYVVGGWADGYTNAIPRMLAGLAGIRKGLIGPWPHAWPHDAVPGPAIGFLQEAVRWWDRWLKEKRNGIEDEPMLRAWIQDPVAPDRQHLDRPGRWVTTTTWPPPETEWHRRHLGEGRLVEVADGDVTLHHRSDQHLGSAAGSWCPYGAAADFPGDQREEDSLSLLFDSPPLVESLELFGNPSLRLRVAADRPLALVVARLCDVAPDGTSLLLSRGVLNLTHRKSDEHPATLVPGTRYDVTIPLDVMGQVVPAGHRLRLALSSAYWPWLWPSPLPVELTVVGGPASWIDLPVRPVSAGDGHQVPFGAPVAGPGLGGDVVVGASLREVAYDSSTRVHTVATSQAPDTVDRLDDGLTLEISGYVNRFAIRDGEPLSARVEAERQIGLSRGEWEVRVRTRSAMTCDSAHFHLTDGVEVYEGERRVFVRDWSRSISRDLV